MYVMESKIAETKAMKKIVIIQHVKNFYAKIKNVFHKTGFVMDMLIVETKMIQMRKIAILHKLVKMK